MKLYFEDCRENRRLIGEPNTWEETIDIIDNFLSEHNFISYYKRVNFYESEWQIDVGSHTEFIILTDITDEVKKQVMKG